MIDFRHVTFYHLCKIQSFTKTANYLHITQPAVTQHIQYLEELYEGELIKTQGRVFQLTEKGQILFNYLKRLFADSKQIETIVKNKKETKTIAVGATLTIGEFMMPNLLSAWLDINDDQLITLTIENTTNLLKKLDAGIIQFAFIEGFFDKAQYDFKKFKDEAVIGICAPNSPLSNQVWLISELVNERLILREKGSGTREVFEQALYEKNAGIHLFKSTLEIANMHVIKSLVKKNQGISFMYYTAVKEEINQGELATFRLNDLTIIREFNFVFQKDSVFKADYLHFLDQFESHILR